MTQTTYNYSLTDTSNGIVGNICLRDEIVASDITIALFAIEKNATHVDIVFKDVLSTADKSTLDAVIAAHVGHLVHELEVQEVKIVEEGLNSSERTNAHYLCKGYSIDIPAVIGDTYSTFSFPFATTVMAMEMIPTVEWAEDEITITVSPDTTVGAITSDVSVSDTVINVSSTVLDYLQPGFYVTITDGVTTNFLGNAITVDKVTSTITVTDAATDAFSATAPTYVQLSVPAIERFHIHGVFPIVFGDVKIGGTYLKPNTPFKIVYHNITGTAKTFKFNMEVLY